MDQNKSTLLAIGGVLLAFSVLLPLIMFAASDGIESFVGAVLVLFIVSPVLFLAGIGFLIAGATRGRMQQQQQVIVVSDPSEVAGLVTHCHQCGATMTTSQRFCNGCGRGVSHG